LTGYLLLLNGCSGVAGPVDNDDREADRGEEKMYEMGFTIHGSG